MANACCCLPALRSSSMLILDAAHVEFSCSLCDWRSCNRLLLLTVGYVQLGAQLTDLLSHSTVDLGSPTTSGAANKKFAQFPSDCTGFSHVPQSLGTDLPTFEGGTIGGTCSKK